MKNENEMKKAYVAPAMRDVKLNARVNLLGGSIAPSYNGGLGYADATAENEKV